MKAPKLEHLVAFAAGVATIVLVYYTLKKPCDCSSSSSPAQGYL